MPLRIRIKTDSVTRKAIAKLAAAKKEDEINRDDLTEVGLKD